MKKPRGLGLYSWRQVRYDTAITFAGGISIGTIFVACGVALIWYGDSAAMHWFGAGMAVTGTFLGHAGAIYWWRRLSHNSREQRKQVQREHDSA
ncbi:MAG TPA: hypothetical protein VFU86_10480 [Terriglobales bacterium]|nr:hypothetical protein [Terriglobales bacterium]